MNLRSEGIGYTQCGGLIRRVILGSLVALFIGPSLVCRLRDQVRGNRFHSVRPTSKVRSRANTKLGLARALDHYSSCSLYASLRSPLPRSVDKV